MVVGDEEGERRQKRKMDHVRQYSRHGGKGGVIIGTSAHQRELQEDQIEKQGRTICPEGCPGSPEGITIFDDSYIVPYKEDVVERAAQDTRKRHRVNYAGVSKPVKEAGLNNPYLVPKDTGVDKRFWNAFHSDFYHSVLFCAKKSRIIKMKFVDFEYMRAKRDREFDRVISACEKFELRDLMSFRYDWNDEIISQFFSTFYCDDQRDELHWMTEGCHYKVDFVTFSRILGFGARDRSYTDIHDEHVLSNSEISYMYTNGKATGFVKGLKSFYYILNNLFRHSVNPKGGSASNLHGTTRNLLARMAPGGARFSVSHFIWDELSATANDAAKSLPYAPYVMFIIERVIGYRFVKDGLHEPNHCENTHHIAAGKTMSAAAADVPESSHSASHSKKKKNKLAKWMKEIFGKCSYATERAYETQLEHHEHRAQAHLSPPPPPLEYDLPSLSGSEFEEDEEEEEVPEPTLAQVRRSIRSHRQGSAVISDDDEEDDDNGDDDDEDIDEEDDE